MFAWIRRLAGEGPVLDPSDEESSAEAHPARGGEPLPEAVTQAPRAPISEERVAALTEELLECFRTSAADLPSFPGGGLEVFRAAQDEATRIEDLVSMIQAEPSVALGILRLANSAFFGRHQEVQVLQDAVVLLGRREVSYAASAAAASAMYRARVLAGSELLYSIAETLRAESLTSAFATAWLAAETGRGDRNRAFLAGMFHDVGKIVALHCLASLGHRDLDEADLVAILEGAHVELGFEAVSAWNLPEYLVEICLEHHSQLQEGAQHSEELHLVRVTSGILQQGSNPHRREALEEEIDTSVAILRLDASRLAALRAELGFLLTESVDAI